MAKRPFRGKARRFLELFGVHSHIISDPHIASLASAWANIPSKSLSCNVYTCPLPHQWRVLCLDVTCGLFLSVPVSGKGSFLQCQQSVVGEAAGLEFVLVGESGVRQCVVGGSVGVCQCVVGGSVEYISV